MKPVLVAHRGGAAESSWIDNSLEAVIYSISHERTDYLEVDVRETREGEYVLFHDEKINGVPVNAMSYEELIDFSGYPVVKLITLLRILNASNKKINIEVKKVASVDLLIQTVFNYIDSSKVLFSSLNKNIINKINTVDKSINKAMVLSASKEVNEMKWIFQLEQAMAEIKTKHIIIPYLAVKLGILNKISSREYNIWSWGVNHQKDMIKVLSDNRISGVITDYPQRFENLEIRTNGEKNA